MRYPSAPLLVQGFGCEIAQQSPAPHGNKVRQGTRARFQAVLRIWLRPNARRIVPFSQRDHHIILWLVPLNSTLLQSGPPTFCHTRLAGVRGTETDGYEVVTHESTRYYCQALKILARYKA